MSRQNGASGKSDRSNPKANKSLAIRLVLKKHPRAKAAVVVDAVKKHYGHEISQNMVYMVKTKANMAANRRELKRQSVNARTHTPMTTAALWVDAIKTARRLLKATGSVANATALLKAVDG